MSGREAEAFGALELDFLGDGADAVALRERVMRGWAEYRAGALPGAPAPDALARVWAYSDFVAQSCAREPPLLADLHASGDLARPYTSDEYVGRVAAALSGCADESALMSALRKLRRREMVRIAWRDLAGWAKIEETLAELSAFAAACVAQASQRLHAWQSAAYGVPLGAGSAAEQQLIVVGMGKLGGGELNFSSDIDLIYTYAEDGETRGGRAAMSNEEYFTRLARQLTRVLEERTADGFVFRVDTRLRPFGDAGPLVASIDALEDYYQTHGRDWERYAWIKARVIAGGETHAQRLLERLRPFVYRRYLDYGAFQSLREMKALIEQQVRRKDMEGNVKLGCGGIREVEFIAQAFQLIRGGREPALRVRPLLQVLEQLASGAYLPDYVCAGLADAYKFLRRTENRLQEAADEQTHALPRDGVGRLRLALAMGYPDWEAFARELGRRSALVHSHFAQVFAAPQAEKASAATDLAVLWQGLMDDAAAQAALLTARYDNAPEALRAIGGLRAAAATRALGAQGRERLDALMPLLLRAVSRAPSPSRTLGRVLSVVEKVARRTTYLALLVENPLALSQLVRLCAASPWISAQLARRPALLDELLDPRRLYAPRDQQALARDLAQWLAAVPQDDLEQQMEVLRHFKAANALRVAAADVAGIYPLMIVSDHLTDTAEAVLGEVLRLAWGHLVARHGVPGYEPHRGAGRQAAGFAIVGYGKLGGIELGYGSDLDLVFLHDSTGEEQMTDGAKPVDNHVFFARLGQRIIHMLSAHTPAGVLYEVDMRLRPSGNAGLLVSSLDAYGDYQRAEAWTWEHQALVRARVVAGDAAVAERFGALRRAVLSVPRDRNRLREDVRNMRERMRAELAHAGPGRFDLRQDPGGITDIEFMVQYHVLAWARDYPQLLLYTDNIRLLQVMAQTALMPAEDARLLADAYRAYRAAVHRLTLQEQPARVAAEEFGEYREQVTRLWRAVME